MKKNLFLTILTVLSLHLYGQKDQQFSPGAELVTSETLTETTPFKSVLFVFQGSSHLVFHFKDFSKRLKKTFRKSGLTIDFDFDLNTENGLKADIAALPKRVTNPASFGLV